MRPYILYGTDNSYFTGKVRPYLRYKGIEHQFKQVNIWTYQRFIIPRTGVKYIPVLQTPEDEVWQDTSVIIDKLEQRFPQRPVLSQGARQRFVALLLEVYADEWFLLPGMHYRWSYLDRQEKAVMNDFGRMLGLPLPAVIKRAAGRRLCRPFKNSLKFLGVTAKTIPAIEAWFEQFLEYFETHLTQHEYLLGSRPCLADFALAGPLGNHSLHDPVSRQLLLNKAPRTVQWIRRINAENQPEGTFLDGDEVPETLFPILRHCLQEHWPILRDTALALPGWVEQHPDKHYISRALGWHEFQIGQVRAQRLLFPNAVWMLQRPLDYLHSCEGEERESVRRLISALGGDELLDFRIPQRLQRERNRLVLAS